MKPFLSRLCLALTLAVAFNSSVQAQTASSSQSSTAASAVANSVENSSANAATTVSPEPTLSQASLARGNALLAAALKALAKEDEIEWIESDQDKIIALYKPSETKVMKGALWILHAPDSPPAWPPSLEILRRNLPLFGWASFALPLPPKNIAEENLSSSASAASSNNSTAVSSSVESSTASSNSASSQESSSVAAVEANASSSTSGVNREKIINQRLDAGFAKLQEKGQLNVVVLIDNSSAALVLTNLAGKSAPNSKIKGLAQALVLVNLQTQEPLSKEQLKTIFSNADLPVMDVFFDPDNAQQAEQRRNHRAEALRQKLKDYQQVIMPAEDFVNIDNAQSFWLQKVRGFMDKKAESEEVKRAQKK